ncbi:MAG TPA: BamA/TamA family outer membrane protein [Bryobacteraceae bacterium]|nr:BamA/TamA family outer membrane protein [Bryobacteraceae bacterium]
MRYAWLGCVLFSSLLCAGPLESDFNVNTRYRVESVIVSGDGWKTNVSTDHNGKISTGLRRDLMALIGENLNPDALDGLAERLKKELNAREVSHHVSRGANPNYLRVEFDVKPNTFSLHANVTKFTYDSKSGWSGGGEAGFGVRQNDFTLGVVSNSDDLPERFAGVTARYENRHLGTSRLGLRFQVESYHEQWNGSTLNELAKGSEVTSDAYRSRQNFEPVATIVLARPLTLEVGTSFERFEDQYPAAHTEASNAFIASLRYHRHLEGSENQQDVEAGYYLRAAARLLASDFVFASHSWTFRYQLTHGKHVLTDDVSAGVITGRAPLSDRFVLGNSSSLRGWNKYDLDPLGGNRMVYNSVEYRYGILKVFYDSGAIWDSGQSVIPRHSVGVGLRESVFTIAVAFPIREGRADPIFMMGMIY